MGIPVSRLGGANLSPSQEDGEDSLSWRATERVHGSSTVVCDLDPDSLYAFRVRSCRNSVFSPYSPEVTFHTPPAPGESEKTLTSLLTVGVRPVLSPPLTFRGRASQGNKGMMLRVWGRSENQSVPHAVQHRCIELIRLLIVTIRHEP